MKPDLRELPPIALVVLAVLLPLWAACAGSTSSVSRARPAASPEQADSLMVRMRSDFERGDFASAQSKARELVHSASGRPADEEAYWLGARASQGAGDCEQAVAFADELRGKYPLSPHRAQALFLAAECRRKLGQSYQSAEALSQLLSEPIEPELQGKALAALRDLTENELGAAELEGLIRSHPSSPLAGEMSLGLAKKEFVRGDYDRAYTLLSDLAARFPDQARIPEAQELLKMAANRRQDPARPAGPVVPNRLGVILPETGGLARYGRYFEQGVTLALEEYNAGRAAPVTFAKADTKGNPVDAVAAVRRLVLEEGVVAIVGSAFSGPSIAAAIECNAWRVPIVCPATQERRVEEIGPWVFHLRVPPEVEVAAMAALATQHLMLEKFAVLAPSSPERKKLARLFAEDVMHRGGDVVAELYYNEGDTDFKKPLQAIRDAAPDALFIPGTPEDLMLVLPQVTFNDLQVQLLGLSDWNAEKLLRLSQRELEGALFPREMFQGKDPGMYGHFESLYQKKYKGEVPPTAASAYLGTRLLLDAMKAGAIDRAQIRDYLASQLRGGADERMREAQSLPILRVSRGNVTEFTSHRKRR